MALLQVAINAAYKRTELIKSTMSRISWLESDNGENKLALRRKISSDPYCQSAPNTMQAETRVNSGKLHRLSA